MLLNKQLGGEVIPSEKKLCHPPYSKLKGFAREKGIKYLDIAALLGISTSTVSMKVNGYSDFYLGEVRVFNEKYNPPTDIFS